VSSPATAPDTGPALGTEPPTGGDLTRSDDLPQLPDAAVRGSLTIADRVVERVAGYAVTQVDGAGAAPRRLLGINVGEARADTAASVTARVEGRTATVSAAVAISWPHSVRTVADQLRRTIRDDVRRVTGIEVAQVDLDVVTFATAPVPSRRVQ
jgi:uncharacterized alkaline shock family protein YloU